MKKLQTHGTVFKLTGADCRTFGGMQWGLQVEHFATPGEGELCSDKWIHAYCDPVLAAFMHPFHLHGDTELKKPLRLWRCKAVHIYHDNNKVKLGCKWLKMVKELRLLQPTDYQRAWFGILCAKKVLPYAIESRPEVGSASIAAERAQWASRALANGSIDLVAIAKQSLKVHADDPEH